MQQQPQVGDTIERKCPECGCMEATVVVVTPYKDAFLNRTRLEVLRRCDNCRSQHSEVVNAR